MKRRNTRYLIFGLIVFGLVFTGVYALLTTTLNITGTATGTGDFKIQFDTATVTNNEKATLVLDDDKTTMNINTNLSFPGDTVTINFTMKNTGSLTARVDDIVIDNPDSADFTIVINGLNSIEGTNLTVGAEITSSIVITWKAESTNPTPTTVPFSITIDYSQATT
jgi:hypothetical protein